MDWVLAAIGVALAAAIYGVLIYNALVALRQKVAEAWSGIDVQLKRRSNLVPNLVETVKGYASHEKELLDQLTRVRATAAGSGPAAAATPDEVATRAAAEGQLGAALSRLFAVAEAYPDLKASRNFQDLHASLDEIERDIQHARRYYNGAVRMLNVKVQSFPSNLIANGFGFHEAAFFELESPAERDLPKVTF